MDVLFDVWTEAWKGYGLDGLYLYVAAAAVAVCAYYNWQRTLLVTWSIVYIWTMAVLLSSDVDLQEGFTVVYVCAYGLVGFLFLGYCFYQNLAV